MDPATHKIDHRRLFPLILNRLELVGEGAEVGVQLGLYSEWILTYWHGNRLYSVDPWREWPHAAYVDEANVRQERQEAIFEEARRRLQGFGERSIIMRKSSGEAVSEFGDSSLDFVYWDVQHHYDAISQDLRLCYPKVKGGGFLCGHDFRDKDIFRVCGVRTAVDEFFSAHKFDEWIVSIEDSSWFIRIP